MAITRSKTLWSLGLTLGLQLLPFQCLGTKLSYSSHLRYSLDGCTVFQKEFHDFNPILLAGDVKRGEAILQGTETHIHLTTSHGNPTTLSVVQHFCHSVFLEKIWKRAVTTWCWAECRSFSGSTGSLAGPRNPRCSGNCEFFFFFFCHNPWELRTYSHSISLGYLEFTLPNNISFCSLISNTD